MEYGVVWSNGSGVAQFILRALLQAAGKYINAHLSLTPDFVNFSNKNQFFEVLFLVFFIFVYFPPHVFIVSPNF